MKVTLIEGTPEELADYEARTGLIGQARSVATTPEPGEGPVPTGEGQTIGGTSLEDEFILRSFVYGRAREPQIGGHVETFIHRVLDLGGTEVEPGTSRSSTDGRADYLLVYDAGPRHYGAVTYVNARNAGLTLRLTKEDVNDLTDPQIKFRNVQPRNGYQVNCPVTTPDAIELAVKLTQRALDKVRRPKNGSTAG